MVQYDLFNLPLPRTLRINDNASRGCLVLSLLLAIRSCAHLVVLLLRLQVVRDHPLVHLDGALVDNSRVLVTNLKTIKFLQTWQLLEDARPIVRLG
mgnify:CR=1 FL=1